MMAITVCKKSQSKKCLSCLLTVAQTLDIPALLPKLSLVQRQEFRTVQLPFQSSIVASSTVDRVRADA
jgi:hypothetical protein